jgi:thiamine-phosphate pyrophosphorylase
MKDLRNWLEVYFITSRDFGHSHEDLAEMALKAGIRMVQFREKKMETGKMVEIAKRLRRMCDDYGAIFIVNDRIDVALACNADGVHVGQEDIPAEEVREVFDGILGVSVRSINEAIRAEKHADYLSIGPVFPTKTKKDAGRAIGIKGLKEIVRAVSIPVVAIGSINRDNVLDVLKAGVDGIAVISSIAAAYNPEDEAKKLLEIVKGYRYSARIK